MQRRSSAISPFILLDSVLRFPFLDCLLDVAKEDSNEHEDAGRHHGEVKHEQFVDSLLVTDMGQVSETQIMQVCGVPFRCQGPAN